MEMNDAESRNHSTAKEPAAPVPNDSRKPSKPTDLTKPFWKYIAKRTLREFLKDRCTDLTAALTYYSILYIFPAILVLVSILGICGQADKTTTALLDIFGDIAPDQTMESISPMVEGLASSPSAPLTLVLGIVAALWTASGYVGAFGRALNRVYEIDEGRTFLRFRATMLAVTVINLLIVVVLAAMLVLSGPVARAVGNFMGLGDTLVIVWNPAKWPIMLVLVIVAMAVLYYATPRSRQRFGLQQGLWVMD